MPKKARQFQKVARDWSLPEPADYILPVTEDAVNTGAWAMWEAWADTDDELSQTWETLDPALQDVFRRKTRIALAAIAEHHGMRME